MSKLADAKREPFATHPTIGRCDAEATRVVHVGDVAFGGSEFVVIAGPCAVESREQIEDIARSMAKHHAKVLRGGAFKPRTNPHTFRGLGFEGVELLRRASVKSGLPFVTEVLSPADVGELGPRVDAFQVGARNMQNFALLDELGRQSKPVLLKRGFGATLSEWLHAAEYVAQGGNTEIILCERGIRSFGGETRFVLDLAGALWAKQHCVLPVVIDPSHATGDPALVAPLTRAAAAAGLDGVMVEVHPDPSVALSDGGQALMVDEFATLMSSLRLVCEAVERPLAS